MKIQPSLPRTSGPCALWLVLILGAFCFACADAEPTLTFFAPTVTAVPLPSPSPTSSSAPSPLPRVATPTATAAPTATDTPRPTPTVTTPPPTPTSACVETRGRIHTGTFYSAIIGQERPYRVYLPPCYGFSDERYPVLYMLHGLPFDDSHWDDIGIDEAADAGIANGTLPPFVIAMPAADNDGTFKNTSGGPLSFEAVLLDEFLPFIESTYRVFDEAAGRAIGGMSRGGVWSLEVAFRNPDRFAAVGGHSAALNVNLAPPVYDPIYLAADPSIRSLRIYLDAGRGDWVLPGMEELHSALEAAVVPHDYVLYEGQHDDSYWSAHVAEYLAFYAAQW